MHSTLRSKEEKALFPDRFFFLLPLFPSDGERSRENRNRCLYSLFSMVERKFVEEEKGNREERGEMNKKGKDSSRQKKSLGSRQFYY